VTGFEPQNGPPCSAHRYFKSTTFFEDDLAALIAEMGADNILFGSDYPHPEGLAQPCTYLDHLPPGTSPADVRKIMGGTLGQLMGIDRVV
jgi:predicted TIM-barrel fold metal-dependent hydrolase